MNVPKWLMHMYTYTSSQWSVKIHSVAALSFTQWSDHRVTTRVHNQECATPPGFAHGEISSWRHFSWVMQSLRPVAISLAVDLRVWGMREMRSLSDLHMCSPHLAQGVVKYRYFTTAATLKIRERPHESWFWPKRWRQLKIPPWTRVAAKLHALGYGLLLV